MTTSRILRALALAAAIAIPVTALGALPAYAADHFTVDNDGMVLGQSTVNSFKAFDGNVESWHDGTQIRQTLTGSFQGRGTVSITFTFSDGSTQTRSAYTDGVQTSVSLSSNNLRSVVRSTTRYDDNRDSNCPTGSFYNPSTARCDYPQSQRVKTVYVGDSPQSLGNCQQLDDDDLSMQGSNSAAFFGHVTYGCTTGHVVAHVSGSLNWMSSTTGNAGGAMVTFTYADGTSQNVFVHQVYATGTTTSNAAIDSTSTKDVRFVQMIVTRDGAQAASTTQRFGDA